MGERSTRATYDEVEIKVPGLGDVTVTDEQVRTPRVVGISVYEDLLEESSYAYVELTLPQLTELRDELSRRIEAIEEAHRG